MYEVQSLLDGEAWLFDSDYFCEACGEDYLGEVETEAAAFALENVKLTREVELFDPAEEYRATVSDYRMGVKDSHTPRAVYAINRHECTNYDELIQGLERGDPADCIRYDAIRARIDQLLGIDREDPWLGLQVDD